MQFWRIIAHCIPGYQIFNRFWTLIGSLKFTRRVYLLNRIHYEKHIIQYELRTCYNNVAMDNKQRQLNFEVD